MSRQPSTSLSPVPSVVKAIACRLTAPLPAALATIGVHGSDAKRLVGACVGEKILRQGTVTSAVHYVQWPLLNGEVSEDLVLCFVDSDTVEIHCHGGVGVSNAILASLASAGCEIVDSTLWSRHLTDFKQNRSCNQIPGENSGPFTALEIRLAAEQALIDATCERAAGILIDQHHGALEDSIRQLKLELRDGNQKAWLIRLDELLGWSDLGLHLTKPWNVVLAGPPNVGKSSLINSLCGGQHAIVHHEAGTTRDWIEAHTSVDGWPVCLTDTAGIRDTDEEIEREGVRRATERIAGADLVVVVVDSTIGWTDEHDKIIAFCQQQLQPPRLLAAWNKWDQPPADQTSSLSPTRQSLTFHSIPQVHCSAINNVAGLLDAISRILVPKTPAPHVAVPFTIQQVDWLRSIWARRQNG